MEAKDSGKQPAGQAPKDACPAWADVLILQIRQLEVLLGNLRPPEAVDSPDWQKTELENIYRRAFGGDDGTVDRIDDEAVESLFQRVARGLTDVGYDAAAIAAFVNARVTDGGRLPYCNAAEVLEALED